MFAQRLLEARSMFARSCKWGITQWRLKPNECSYQMTTMCR